MVRYSEEKKFQSFASVRQAIYVHSQFAEELIISSVELISLVWGFSRDNLSKNFGVDFMCDVLSVLVVYYVVKFVVVFLFSICRKLICWDK